MKSHHHVENGGQNASSYSRRRTVQVCVCVTLLTGATLVADAALFLVNAALFEAGIQVRLLTSTLVRLVAVLVSCLSCKAMFAVRVIAFHFFGVRSVPVSVTAFE